MQPFVKFKIRSNGGSLYKSVCIGFKKIRDKAITLDIEQVILSVKGASRIADLKNIKKLNGFTSAYRISIGQYRLGLYINGKTVEFARFMHRKDLYRYFP